MRQISLGFYATMIVCFFFPWFEVSCGSIGFEFTGFQLAKGSYEGSLISMEAIQDFLNSLESRNQGAQWWLFSVPAACVLGIVSQLFRHSSYQPVMNLLRVSPWRIIKTYQPSDQGASVCPHGSAEMPFLIHCSAVPRPL